MLDNAIAYPQIRALTPIDRDITASKSVPIQLVGGEVHVASEDEAHGNLTIGPATMGGVVMLHIDPQHAIRGPSAAPVAVSAFGLTDDLWDTGIGPLIPSTNLRGNGGLR